MSLEVCKIAILGPVGVGKTSLGLRLTKNDFQEDYEDVLRSRLSVDNDVCTLEITDTGGQEDFRSMLDSWIHENEAFVLVYSVTEERSVELLKNEFLDRILREHGRDSHHPPVVIVGNKTDRPDKKVSQEDAKRSIMQAIRTYEGEHPEITNPFEPEFIEASAKTGFNVEQSFAHLVKMHRRAKQGLLAKDKSQLGQVPSSTKNGQKKSCCTVL